MAVGARDLVDVLPGVHRGRGGDGPLHVREAVGRQERHPEPRPGGKHAAVLLRQVVDPPHDEFRALAVSHHCVVLAAGAERVGVRRCEEVLFCPQFFLVAQTVVATVIAEMDPALVAGVLLQGSEAGAAEPPELPGQLVELGVGKALARLCVVRLALQVAVGEERRCIPLTFLRAMNESSV